MSNGFFFTQEELEPVDVAHLRNILDYLGVAYEKRNSKAKLILLILRYQAEMQPHYEVPPEIPRYSVRIKRIMDAKEKGTI